VKAYGWIPVALLAGLIVGSWGPGSDLRKARAELAELRKTQRGGRSPAARFDSVSSLLRIPDPSRRPAVETVASDAPATTSQTNLVTPELDVATVAGAGDEGAGTDAVRRRPTDLQERIDEATELWRIRSDIARNTFVANAQLNDEATTQFDVLVASMNVRLQDRLEHWAESIKSAEEMGPEIGVRMINDLTDVMVVTYEEMDRTMPGDWRDRSGGSVDLTDFIDPSVAKPLIGVENKIEDGPRRRGRERALAVTVEVE